MSDQGLELTNLTCKAIVVTTRLQRLSVYLPLQILVFQDPVRDPYCCWSLLYPPRSVRPK